MAKIPGMELSNAYYKEKSVTEADIDILQPTINHNHKLYHK